MNYLTIENGKVKKLRTWRSEVPEGAIELSDLEYGLVVSCDGNLDDGINALVKVAEKILEANKAVVFNTDIRYKEK